VSPAIASLRKAVELDGSQASYKIALGQALLQADRYQDAYEVLKPLNISSLDASHRSSYALLFAQAATKTNRTGEAVSVLTTQARADARNARLQQALGSAYSAAGDEPNTFEAFTQSQGCRQWAKRRSCGNLGRAALELGATEVPLLQPDGTGGREPGDELADLRPPIARR